MSVIGYTSWGLIPVDPDPATGECTSPNPPMISSLALDPGASLFFAFSALQPTLHVVIETTALSAEGIEPHNFSFYSGSEMDAFSSSEMVEGAKNYDGQFAVFTCTVRPAAPLLKVHNAGSRLLVVNKVSFKD